MKAIKNLLISILTMSCGYGLTLTTAYAQPKIESWSLENGAQVYWVQNQSLPILDVQVAFDGGRSLDPADKVSLATQMAMMSDKGIEAGLDVGQSPALDENQLTDAWLNLGANFDVSAARDELTYTLRTLSYPEVMPAAVMLASRVISSPSFPENVLERDQERMVATLKESLTQPASIASRTFSELVYGGHPYGQQTQEETILAVSVKDLRDYHASTILPCRARISIVGDVTRPQANAIATSLLAHLPQENKCSSLPKVGAVPALKHAVNENVPFNAAQAQIYIGQPGIKRSDPDFITLVVANHILGGNGFSSRLMQEVREKRGLTYGVYSSFSPGKEAGAFVINLKTRPDQAKEAAQVAMTVLKDFVQNGPSQEELIAAKANLLGGFPLMFDSNQKLLAQVANIARNDLPLDYLEQWPQLVEAVTAEQIQAAMQKVIQPEQMVTVILGAESQ